MSQPAGPSVTPRVSRPRATRTDHRARPAVWIVALGVCASVAVASWNIAQHAATRPDPFGSLEQAYAALPADVDWPRNEQGEIIRPISMRRIATIDKFTGRAAEFDPFLVYLSGIDVPAQIPEGRDYQENDRPDTANGLRALARAWPQADFSPRFDETLAVALRLADHPDPLIRSQAGLLLLSMESGLRDDAASDRARAMLASDGRFGGPFRETWIGVVEHARRVASP